MNIRASAGVPNLNPQEYSELDPADMLSRVPDTVLSHILSLLPTKCAVATSVLSRRWEFLWTQIHFLYFNDKMPSIIQTDDQDAGRGMDFSQFVERVMLLRDSKYSMEIFHLNCRLRNVKPMLSFPRLLPPSFLTSLKLEAANCLWELLQYLLDKAVNLEALTYHEKRSCDISQHQQAMRWEVKPRLSCLSSVSIIGFHGSPCNIELVEYMLQNAEVLSNMEIRCSSETTFVNKYRLLQKLAEMSRVSPSCKIIFS